MRHNQLIVRLLCLFLHPSTINECLLHDSNCPISATVCGHQGCNWLLNHELVSLYNLTTNNDQIWILSLNSCQLCRCIPHYPVGGRQGNLLTLSCICTLCCHMPALFFCCCQFCLTWWNDVINCIVKFTPLFMLFGAVLAPTWKSFNWYTCIITITGLALASHATESISIAMFFAFSMNNFETVL